MFMAPSKVKSKYPNNNSRMKYRILHLFLFLTLILLIGCSPKTGSGVLCFFFDGVPNCKDSINDIKVVVIPVPDTTAVIAGKPFGKGPDYVIHSPYMKRECTACHDNSAASSIVSYSQSSICYKCHTDFKNKYQYVHGPVAGGYCTACHTPHESEIAKLLKRKGQELCLLCHTSAQIMKDKAHATIGDSDCTKCHNPHGGSTRSLLL